MLGAAFYLWRAALRRTWQATISTALICGLLGAVALGALAGARRTASAYGRYLAAINQSHALVNVPGRLPAMPATRPIELISRLPGISAAAAGIGLAANPVPHGHVDNSFATNNLMGSYAEPGIEASYFGQDKASVLAGRMPGRGATDEIALTGGIARLFGARVGSRVTYQFYRVDPRTSAATPTVRRTYQVTAIIEIPPALADQSDEQECGLLPPAATRQLLGYYAYGWVGVRLDRGTAGIPRLQHQLAGLAALVQRQARRAHVPLPGLAFTIRTSAVLQAQVQQAIRPQAIALTVLGAIAALAMLVLVGQGLAQLVSRSSPDIAVIRALGGTSGQAALAAALPGLAAVAVGVLLAMTGAVAVSPLAPVGPVRRFDPVRGVQGDGLVIFGGGAALLAAALLVLAVIAGRAVRQQVRPPEDRRSAIAQAAMSAGLPVVAVVGSRNALEPGSGRRAVPVRAALTGSIAAVTAVVAAVVFGTSLTGLLSHPVRYGWNWDVLLQAEDGYGAFYPARTIDRLVAAQPAVAAWSKFAFSQLPVDGHVIPVLGLQRKSGSVEPPTTSGQPLAGDGQIELGTLTLRQLGKKIGDTVEVGRGRQQRRLTIVGTVTLPSFGIALTDHVSLGRGAMLSEQALLTAEGSSPDRPQVQSVAAVDYPSAVAIDLFPGTTAAQRARLVTAIASADPDGTPGGTYELRRVLAAAVFDASKMGSQPLALALGLAAAALASLALTVLTFVRRRRGELALLKTLGMTRAQIRAVVCWQTSVILTIAALAGIPLGVAAGRWAWTSFAGSLGVMPAPQVPVLWLAAGFAALLAAGNLLAVGPAEVAARIRPAATLRAE